VREKKCATSFLPGAHPPSPFRRGGYRNREGATTRKGKKRQRLCLRFHLSTLHLHSHQPLVRPVFPLPPPPSNRHVGMDHPRTTNAFTAADLPRNKMSKPMRPCSIVTEEGREGREDTQRERSKSAKPEGKEMEDEVALSLREQWRRLLAACKKTSRLASLPLPPSVLSSTQPSLTHAALQAQTPPPHPSPPPHDQRIYRSGSSAQQNEQTDAAVGGSRGVESLFLAAEGEEQKDERRDDAEGKETGDEGEAALSLRKKRQRLLAAKTSRLASPLLLPLPPPSARFVVPTPFLHLQPPMETNPPHHPHSLPPLHNQRIYRSGSSAQQKWANRCSGGKGWGG
jgi:hypothetical protein